jgi:hypothetical protein
MLINKIKIGANSVIDGYINIPISSGFSTETQQYENINRNLNLAGDDIINPTIDYEKIKFYPSGETKLSDSLTFKLHFNNGTGWDVDSTLISDIGFDDDDVLNRRKRLEKSFIRLSFYDSKDLKTQNLLYYSTIFIDSDSLYSRYINDGLLMTNLKSEFIVQNPKLSKKIKSFEGFNIYLFKDDLLKNSVKTIYMRVDFNNASNGRSTLFIKNHPTSTDAYTMQELFENLFYEINCGYDDSNETYVYWIDGKSNTYYEDEQDKNIKNTIIIDLYQAKVI